MSEKIFNIYPCGGAGIGVANEILRSSRHQEYINKIVGLDTSDANQPLDGKFEVIRLKGTEGSGSNKRTNMHLYEPFVKQVLAAHEPNKINILIFAGSGGSGSGIGPYMARVLLEQGIPCLSIVIGDRSSLKELDNTVSTLRSLANQTRLGHPVCFCYQENELGYTHTAINKKIVQTIDAALLSLNLENERIDYADIKNLFFFNQVVAADPILTQMTFLTDDLLEGYMKQPVAALSLFPNAEAIMVPFSDLLYRKAGIFGEKNSGYNIGCHVVLDHGSSLQELEALMASQMKKTDAIGSRFKVQQSAVMGGGDDDGMFV